MGMTLTPSGSPIPNWMEAVIGARRAPEREAEASWTGPPPLLTGFSFASASPQDQQEEAELKGTLGKPERRGKKKKKKIHKILIFH